MSAKDPEPKKSRAATVREHWSDKQDLSGSASPWLTCNLANQVLRLPWRGSREDSDTKLLHDQAMLAAMAGIAPRDPVEGLLAAQMVAVHEASMECFRRAALPEQIFAGRELGLKYGDKLARTYAALVETLDRHRGKGQQVVRVEHVTVQAGGQAIVGTVTQGGGGGCQEREDQPHAPGSIAYEPQPALRCPDPQREPMPVPGGAGREAMPDARGCRRQRRTHR